MDNPEARVPHWPQQPLAIVVLSSNLLDNLFFIDFLPNLVLLPSSCTDALFLFFPLDHLLNKLPDFEFQDLVLRESKPR